MKKHDRLEEVMKKAGLKAGAVAAAFNEHGQFSPEAQEEAPPQAEKPPAASTYRNEDVPPGVPKVDDDITEVPTGGDEVAGDGSDIV